LLGWTDVRKMSAAYSMFVICVIGSILTLLLHPSLVGIESSIPYISEDVIAIAFILLLCAGAVADRIKIHFSRKIQTFTIG